MTHPLPPLLPPDGYVANGHPTVATHQKMAAQIIAAMETAGIFPTTK